VKSLDGRRNLQFLENLKEDSEPSSAKVKTEMSLPSEQGSMILIEMDYGTYEMDWRISKSELNTNT
jgi:hypothetical protein